MNIQYFNIAKIKNNKIFYMIEKRRVFIFNLLQKNEMDDRFKQRLEGYFFFIGEELISRLSTPSCCNQIYIICFL